LISGVAGTARDPVGYPPATFPGESTAILGAATTKLMDSISETSASWSIPFDEQCFHLFESGLLIISSIRYFAGLHSKVYDSKAKIELNNKVVDFFGLREQPPHHSDYFHRLPLPKIPIPKLVSTCQTIYSWPLLKEKLVNANEQAVKITIENYVRWDIDYLGVLIEMKKKKHHVFISHNWNDKPIARKLATDLSAKGIGVWVDEAEIKLGDSLITKIRDGIDKVDYVFVLLSKHSIDSEWVKKEVEIAMNQEIEGKKVKVVPILLHDVDLPGFLKGKLYGDLRSMDRYDALLSQIMDRVNAT
jgi:hypothetical protein